MGDNDAHELSAELLDPYHADDLAGEPHLPNGVSDQSVGITALPATAARILIDTASPARSAVTRWST